MTECAEIAYGMKGRYKAWLEDVLLPNSIQNARHFVRKLAPDESAVMVDNVAYSLMSICAPKPEPAQPAYADQGTW